MVLEVEDGQVIMNMPSNGEEQTRRVKIQVGGVGCTRYPTPPYFLPLVSLLRLKLAFQASQRNDTQQELSLPNLRFGEPGGEDSRWERRRHIETQCPKGR